MIQELILNNFGLCARAEIAFKPGLNTITGETGAGKSTILEALDLLLGARADNTLIRQGASRATLEIRLEIDAESEITHLLDQWDIPAEEDNCLILKRVILHNKASRAYINGSSATLSQLRKLRSCLADFHGQFDQQKLMNHPEQIVLYDEWLGQEMADLQCQYKSTYSKLQTALKQELQCRDNLNKTVQRIEEVAYSLDEIEKAGIESGEVDKLREKEHFLKNIENLRQAISSLYTALRGDESGNVPGAIQAVRSSSFCLAPLQEAAPDDIEQILNALDGAGSYLEEAVSHCDCLSDRLESCCMDTSDSFSVDDLNSRLRLYGDLFRKYNCRDEDELLLKYSSFQSELKELKAEESRYEMLPETVKLLHAQALETARSISRLRQKHAKKLGHQISSLLSRMGAPHATFQIDISQSEADIAQTEGNNLNNRGMDRVEFLVSMNAGEAPLPLKQAASGGELSRIMLALKSINDTNASGPASSVFDEIDAGIGGETAYAVASLLRQISRHRQIICATHLPAVAGAGDHHIAVAKHIVEGRTEIIIKSLNTRDRQLEIERMLGGKQAHGASEMAKALLNRSHVLESAADSGGKSRGLNRKKGFTLVEVLVSIIVIGVLASVAFPLSRIQNVREREYQLREHLILIRRALQNYRDAETSYPVSLETLVITGYLPRVPPEPFGFAWEYRAFGTEEFKAFGTGHPLWEVADPADRIQDIRTANPETAINGTPYASW